MATPTDAEIREYLSGYYEQHDDYEKFKIKRIYPSQELNARDADVYTEYTDTMDGEGGVICETVHWTLWYEDGRVYGEH